MLSFVFIRHGQAEHHINNDIERTLTQEGILQAQKRALSVKDYSFDLVITSSSNKSQTNCQMYHTGLWSFL